MYWSNYIFLSKIYETKEKEANSYIAKDIKSSLILWEQHNLYLFSVSSKNAIAAYNKQYMFCCDIMHSI